MTLRQIGRFLLSSGMVGLCLAIGAKAGADNNASVSSFVYNLSDVAEVQFAPSWLVSHQPLPIANDPMLLADNITADNAILEKIFEIPSQFHGEWNSNLEDCGTPWGDSRLHIGADYIEFYESSGPVVEIVAQGDHDLTVTTELSGEGATWLDKRYFQLSPDLQDLETTFDPLEPGFVRYRCPN